LISLLEKGQTPKYHFHQYYNYKDFDMKVFAKKNTTYTNIFVCETGHKSYDIVSKLKQNYPELKVFSLEGGMAS
jgi:rhodanese-related sulfurtransferase